MPTTDERARDDDGRPLVLVVDDDDVTPVVVALLGEEGFRVVAQSDPHEARTLIEGGLRPDLMILNLTVKGLAGWDLWDFRQAVESLRRTPVIVLSTTGTNSRVGDAHILSKPISDDALRTKIRELKPVPRA